MSDDPFAEPHDSEATMIRPRPGGRGAGAAAPPPPSAGARTAAVVPTVGVNRLVAAASPVLGAAIRLTAERGRNPDPERLKRGMVEAIREFERQALQTGLDTQSLRAARYALCATVDDLVLSTPWGAASSWTAQSLTSIFHNEVSGGERFFDILEQMQKDLGRHAEVVELMYLCTSLGFEGRYRVMPRGTAALAELRDGIYRTIRNRRGEFERDLSGALARHQYRLQAARPAYADLDPRSLHAARRLPDLRRLQFPAGLAIRPGLRRAGRPAAARHHRGAAPGARRAPAAPAAADRRGRVHPSGTRRCNSSWRPRSSRAWSRCSRTPNRSPSG